MGQQEAARLADAFELTIQVKPDDIDQLGHVNNVTYLRWVQDIAVAHWKATAPEEDQKKLFWVVIRHEIDYKQPAFLGEALLGRTWVGQAAGLKFERHTEFVRANDGKLVAKARTIWCPINALTGRPVEVSPEVRASFSKP
jgi:acyl-CoA thioester hydrolase